MPRGEQALPCMGPLEMVRQKMIIEVLKFSGRSLPKPCGLRTIRESQKTQAMTRERRKLEEREIIEGQVNSKGLEEGTAWSVARRLCLKASRI